MAMGRRSNGQQQEMFVATSEIRSSANPFYWALDRLLEKHGFDTFAEDTCRAFYAENRGRPGIPPEGVFPDDDGGVSGRDRLGARDSVAVRGLYFTA